MGKTSCLKMLKVH